MSWVRSHTAAALLLVVASSACAARPAVPLAPSEDAAFNVWLRAVQHRIITSALRAQGYPRSARIQVAFYIHHDPPMPDSYQHERVRVVVPLLFNVHPAHHRKRR